MILYWLFSLIIVANCQRLFEEEIATDGRTHSLFQLCEGKEEWKLNGTEKFLALKGERFFPGFAEMQLSREVTVGATLMNVLQNYREVKVEEVLWENPPQESPMMRKNKNAPDLSGMREYYKASEEKESSYSNKCEEMSVLVCWPVYASWRWKKSYKDWSKLRVSVNGEVMRDEAYEPYGGGTHYQIVCEMVALKRGWKLKTSKGTHFRAKKGLCLDKPEKTVLHVHMGENIPIGVSKECGRQERCVPWTRAKAEDNGLGTYDEMTPCTGELKKVGKCGPIDEDTALFIRENECELYDCPVPKSARVARSVNETEGRNSTVNSVWGMSIEARTVGVILMAKALF